MQQNCSYLLSIPWSLRKSLGTRNDLPLLSSIFSCLPLLSGMLPGSCLIIHECCTSVFFVVFPCVASFTHSLQDGLCKANWTRHGHHGVWLPVLLYFRLLFCLLHGLFFKHFISVVRILLCISELSVHVLQAYKKTDVFPKGLQLESIAAVCAIIAIISGFEPSLKIMDPKYFKLLTTKTINNIKVLYTH